MTFNIRDKGKEQYQYLIEFKENKMPGLSNTAVKNLLRTDQASYGNSISQNGEKSTPVGQENSGNVKKTPTEGRLALPKDGVPKVPKWGKESYSFAEVAGEKLRAEEVADFQGKLEKRLA